MTFSAPRWIRQQTGGLLFFVALWPLALLTPFLPGLPRPTNGGLTWRQELITAALVSATTAALWLRARRRDTRPAPARPLELGLLTPLGLFVAWSAVSFAWAANGFAALHYAATWTLYLLFFFLVSRAAAHTRPLRAAVTLLALVVLVIAVANVVGHLTTPDSLLRQHGLGEPMAVTIPFFAALALRVRRSRAALLCGAAAVAAWLAVLQIAERAPFIAVCVGLLLLAACACAFRQYRPRNVRRAVVLASALAFCFALQAAPTPFAEGGSIHQPVLKRLGETSEAEKNTRVRFLFWWSAVEMWRAHPLTGAGAGGFETAFPEARAAFAARQPDSPLVLLNEQYLAGAAHNEYLQILAETGAVGFALFAAFCCALLWAAARALRRSHSPLVPGAVAGLAAFAFSSGASSISFRWTGSGLVFFFLAALVLRFALQNSRAESKESEAVALPFFRPRALAAASAFSLILTCGFAFQAAKVLTLARAQASGNEELFRAAVRLNPYDPAAHYNFGVWLYFQKREAEAVPYLRFAVARGFNTSTCYAYLAWAEEAAGDLAASERTLASAVRVYPKSIFLRVRHASALARAGRAAEADAETAKAMGIDPRHARAWHELIENDIDAATAAARRDKGVAFPGQLSPEDAVFAVLHENERRFPRASASGWRASMRNSLAE